MKSINLPTRQTQVLHVQDDKIQKELQLMMRVCSIPNKPANNFESNLVIEAQNMWKLRQNREQNKVKLITINLFLLPPIPNIEWFTQSLYKNLRMFEFARRHMPQYDVLCLQEVFTTLSSRKQQLTQLAYHAGLIYSAQSDQPKICDLRYTDGGLLTLSRYPIIQKDFIAFKDAAFSDKLSLKGVLYTQIEMPNDGILHLFNTHLNASVLSTDPNQHKLAYDVRNSQLQQLRQMIEEKISQNQRKLNYHKHTFLLCGDLNIDSCCSSENNQFEPGILEKSNFKQEKLNEIQQGMIDLIRYEYDDFMELMKGESGNKYEVRDFIQEKIKNNLKAGPLFTYGDVQKIRIKDEALCTLLTNEEIIEYPREVGLTEAEEFGLKARLDYILEIKKIETCDLDSTGNSDFSSELANKFEQLISVEQESVMIDPLYTETTSPDTDHVLQKVFPLPFSQISDHAAVTAGLILI